MDVDIYKKINRDKETIKRAVKEHWEKEPCESRSGTSNDRKKYFDDIDRYRYSKSPFIDDFAKFEEARGRRVLEIGLGSASDFIRWARGGAELWGIDLTASSLKLAKERLTIENLKANVQFGDVEAIDSSDNFFDLVYSYGVIHHTPDTLKAATEICRVLKPGGTAKVMIYHYGGLSWLYLWILFALLKGRPWISRREVVFYHDESLGTKVYTIGEARKIFAGFSKVNIRTVISSGDVLDFQLSKKYQDKIFFRTAQRILSFMKYFRSRIPSALGSMMLIEATK